MQIFDVGEKHFKNLTNAKACFSDSEALLNYVLHEIFFKYGNKISL